MVAALFISGRDWLLPAALFLALSLGVVFWSYRQAAAGGSVRALCAFLKLLGIAALAACLLEPLWSGQRAKPGANFFVLLADNSQGMQIKDQGETRSRGQLLQALLTGESAQWQNKLNENFQVRRYFFDSHLQPTREFSELLFDGRSSAMGVGLNAIGDRFNGQALAGILLFTDGNATDIPDGSPDLRGLPPVYPVVMGSDVAIKDLALNNVTVSQTSFEDAPVTIQADANAVGYAGGTIVAQLLAVSQESQAARTNLSSLSKASQTVKESREIGLPGGNARPAPETVVAEQTQKVPRDGENLSFRFQVKPDKSGVLFYRLRVSSKTETNSFEKPQTSSEATLANNSRIVVVDRGRGPYRILYVSGRPNWEYKFLQRAVEADDQIQLVGLIRVAKREPKFDFRGRVGESSNPLFRGFGNQSKEETERYDQPVLVRLNTRDEVELRGGFPKTAEELYAYHAVIVDDLEAEFFTPDQRTLVQKFVSERGGGFLMLGGQESFQQGKFQRTPIGDMLPVYLDQSAPSSPLADLHLALTREGWLQPWARLRNNEADERSRQSGMPAFQVLNDVRGIKPGASAISTVTDPEGKLHPALVVQRFGNGRTGALLIGDLWRWGLRDEELHRDMDKAWRQMLRWLVADVPERVSFQLEQQRGDPNEAVQLQVRVRDQKFQPLDNATVTLSVQTIGQSPSTNGPATARTIRLNAEPALSEPGLYQATYIPRESGGYKAEAVVTNNVGAEVGRTELGWANDLAAEEFRSLKPNRALLESIAKKTGGEVIQAGQLAKFVESLPNRKVPITEDWNRPLWHQSGVFLLALACFIAEWGLRRWKGLV